MVFKLLTVAAIFLAVAWMLAGGRAALARRGDARTPARVPRADDLVSCGRCGVWLPVGQRCDCAGRVEVDDS